MTREPAAGGRRSSAPAVGDGPSHAERPGHAERAGESLVSSDVRRHNLSLVARSILEHGPGSRSRLADATGLTRGSVTALTAALLEAGVLREVPPKPAASTRAVVHSGTTRPRFDGTHDAFPAGTDTQASRSAHRGRPLTLLELAADDTAVLVLQLDADQAIAELSTIAGEVLTRTARHHGRPMGEPDAVLDVLAGVLTEALDLAANLGRRVADTTVIAFAPVHGDPPVVIADTDLAWGRVDVIAGLRAREPRLDASATLRSDSPLAAVAELRALGAAPAAIRDLVYLKSNSGIGGAFLIDGRIVDGARGMAGALGHLPIVPDGERCACGQRGCLVTVAGPDAVLTAAGMGEALERDGLGTTLDAFVARVQAGEIAAVEAWEAAASWIARALQILAGTLDPQAIVLGGYWVPLISTIDRCFRLDRPDVAGIDAETTPHILPGILGERAALLGASQLARERLLVDPLALAAR